MAKSGPAATVPEESEASLIARAQTAVSRCNWEVGECAAIWTKRFARGRTDADFAALVSLSADQVYQRRRVWETFADVYQNYPSLKWSHFYASINWDDAAECLQWAEDVQAGVAEMKAWRRAQRGEELDAPSLEETLDGLSPEPMLRGEAAPFDHQSVFSVSAHGDDGDDGDQAHSLTNRIAGEAVSGYAPFNAGAVGVPSQERAERQPLTTEQVCKRLTTAIERCQMQVTDQFVGEFHDLPDKVRKRFLKAVQQLAEKVQQLA